MTRAVSAGAEARTLSTSTDRRRWCGRYRAESVAGDGVRNGGGCRSGVVEALDPVATKGAEFFDLLFGLGSFGNDFEPESVGQVDESGEQCARRVFETEARGEAVVDLDHVDREPVEV